jgi:hypothetical protein
MQRVVDGLYQAVAIPRAYFATFSTDPSCDNGSFQIKYAANSPQLLDLTVALDEDEIFVHAMAEKKTLVFSGSGKHGDNGWHGGGDGAVLMIRLAGHCVGLLYGEVAVAEALSEDQTAGFRQLGQQIPLILAQTPE